LARHTHSEFFNPSSALAIVVLTLRNTVLLVIGVCSVIGLRQSLSPGA